jgi:hypothetical protein
VLEKHLAILVQYENSGELKGVCVGEPLSVPGSQRANSSFDDSGVYELAERSPAQPKLLEEGLGGVGDHLLGDLHSSAKLSGFLLISHSDKHDVFVLILSQASELLPAENASVVAHENKRQRAVLIKSFKTNRLA